MTSDLLSRYPAADGKGATVAILDSGVDPTHPALAGAHIEGVVISERFGRISVRDFDGIDRAGHGTACAGRVLRLAPKARILSVRFIGASLSASSAALLAALLWVSDQTDIHVVNMSLGTTNTEFGLKIVEGVDRLYSRGIPVIAAAGYAQNAFDFPGDLGSPISVDAIHAEDDERLEFREGNIVEFAARGRDVHVPWLDGKTQKVTGSSFAAALVAGRVARFKSLDPTLRVWEIKSLLMRQAVEQKPSHQ